VTSVVTYNLANNSSTFDSSNYLFSAENARITLNFGAIWPADLRPAGTCEITYVAGWGDAASNVPMPIRTAIKMHAAAMYESRGMCDCGTPPDSAQALLKQYRVRSHI
ncbi:MAG: hypothetical protein JWN34_2803, partial [Bryobacterales bacterium]|nr:hypothetical protein [Bryobacterales bacterium]